MFPAAGISASSRWGRLGLAINPVMERYFMRVWREQAGVCGVVGVFAYDTGSNAS